MKNIEDITYEIRGAAFTVYNELGPGLLENIYSLALSKEFDLRALRYKREYPVPVIYKGSELGTGYRLDFLVENRVIVELKSVDALTKLHFKQVLTYLNVCNLPIGILINFNTLELDKNMKSINRERVCSL